MFCVYLTIYSGNLLPKRYIGSSSAKKVLSGYNGSLASKKYSEIYKQEQRNNKKLFRTRILSLHNTREEAFQEELRLQIQYDVVKNENYMNRSYANPKGCYGNTAWENHPLFGKTGPAHPNYGKKRTEEQSKAQSLLQTGKKRPKQSLLLKDRFWSVEHRINIGLANRKAKSDTGRNAIVNSAAWKTRDKKRKAVLIDGKYFHTLKDAATALNKTSYLIRRLVNDGMATYTERRT